MDPFARVCVHNVMRILLWVLVGAVFGSGCVRGPAVRTSKDLPLERVVLYRNGVGYFERHGQFKGDEVEFHVRKEDVGDFLSSLTAVTADGRVESVSFEVDEPERQGGDGVPPPRPIPLGSGEAYLVMPPGAPVDAPDVRDRDRRVDVRFRLAGKKHTLRVSYVVAAPIWKPTYRVIFDDEGALLQAWAVVQNHSGEDWEGVKLSLTTGAPIAFRSDLEEPVTPPRPRISDRGEQVYAVPGAETSIAQRQDDFDGDEREEAPADARAGAAQPAPMAKAARSAALALESAPPPAPPMSVEALQRSLGVSASAVTASDGVTRYDFDGEVTIPNGGSTMVAILSKRVPGESAHLFAPDGGVPGSHVHPCRVARFTNPTGAALERGPVAVGGEGDFLGQGVLDPMPRGATAFVPFALDRALVVEPRQKRESLPGRLVRVTRGQVIVETSHANFTTYEGRNGGDRPAKLYIRHHRMAGAELHEPPEGVELTPGRALVPVTIPAEGSAKVVVEERTLARRTVSLLSSEAAEAVKLYLEGAAVDAAQGPALRAALELRDRLAAVQSTLARLEGERRDVERTLQETRANLEAIKKVEGAADLRKRLVQRISEMDRRSDEIVREVVERRTEESELRVRLDEAVREITLVVPGEAE